MLDRLEALGVDRCHLCAGMKLERDDSTPAGKGRDGRRRWKVEEMNVVIVMMSLLERDSAGSG